MPFGVTPMIPAGPMPWIFCIVQERRLNQSSCWSLW